MHLIIIVLFLVVAPQALAIQPEGPLRFSLDAPETVWPAEPSALAAAGGNPVAALPLFFVENIGQTDPNIRYYVDAPGLRAGFANDSVVFQKHGKVIRMRFVDGNPNVTVSGNDLMIGRANFFTGDQSGRSAKGASLYHLILYRELYPGIDLTYSPSGATIKSEFVVRPGSNPAAIHLQYQGDSRISLDPSGHLLTVCLLSRGSRTKASSASGASHTPEKRASSEFETCKGTQSATTSPMFNRLPGTMLALGHTHQCVKGP